MKLLLCLASLSIAGVSGAQAFSWVAGAASGSGQVVLHNRESGSLDTQFLAYERSYAGGINVAVGDLDGDGIQEIVTSTRAGSAPHVKVFNGNTLSNTASFFSYPGTFTGGVSVAVGDLNKDGRAEIFTGSETGASHIKAFDFATTNEVSSFFAFSPGVAIGVNIASGDLNGDGVQDFVVGAGAGAGPQVKVFSGSDQSVLRGFFAYDTSFSGGVSVATGDINGDGVADIITGARAGGGPHVKVFDGVTGNELRSIFAFDASFTGGVSVSTVLEDGITSILVGQLSNGGQVKEFNTDFGLLGVYTPFGSSYTGGVNVAGVQGMVPEPTSILALTLGTLALLKRKRSK